MLEPLRKEIIEKMEHVCGPGKGEAPLPKSSPYPNGERVKSLLMPCERCKQPTAMLIVAEDAETPAQLADYERMMYAKIRELNVPTWVVGREKETVINGEFAGEALVKKVWPNKTEPQYIASTVLNPKLDELMQNHCI